MTLPESTLTHRDRFVPWLIVLVVLVVLATLASLFSLQMILAGYMSFSDALKFSLPLWLPWVVFAPLIVWLAFRFPPEKERLLTSVAVHLAACALVICGNQASARYLMANDGFEPPHSGMFHPQGHPPGPAPDESDESDFPPYGPPPDGKPRGPKPIGRPAMAQAAMDILIYGILLSVCQTVTSSRRARDREHRALAAEAHLAQARLSVLRMQLNPHFLFNSLNGISTLVHTDPRAADDMIGNLSELLRLSLDTTGEQEIPLLRELDFLQRYLDIEQARFGERLSVVRDIARDTLTAFVPTLLLQPVIENAIRHGFEKITTQGIVEIVTRREGDHLQIVVSDNGSGLADDSREGIGLANTRARLQVLYGANQHLQLRNLESGGCAVEIRIPYHHEPLVPGTRPSP